MLSVNNVQISHFDYEDVALFLLCDLGVIFYMSVKLLLASFQVSELLIFILNIECFCNLLYLFI